MGWGAPSLAAMPSSLLSTAGFAIFGLSVQMLSFVCRRSNSWCLASRLGRAAALVLVVSAIAHVAAACDKCRLTGASVHDARPVGGDDWEDALVPPSGPASHGHGGASANFTVAGGQWPQPGGLGSPVILTYSYQNMFDGGLKMPGGEPLPERLIRRSIEEALRLWASVAPISFVEVPDDGSDPYSLDPNPRFGQIRFRHTYLNGPDIPGQQPTVKAQAYFPFSGGHIAGDVEFDNGDPWQEIGELSKPDLLGAAIHEIGHTLGLHHTDIPQANMYWIFTRYAGPGTGKLHPDDIAGIRSIYGAGSGVVIPMEIPEPSTWVMIALAACLARHVRSPRVRIANS
jgi:hypothetical protein